MNCSLARLSSSSLMLLSEDNTPAVEGRWADIYWGRLLPHMDGKGGVAKLYNDWKAWIHMLHPYAPPNDPLHIT